MREIPVDDKVAFVDSEDYDHISFKYRWHLTYNGYAVRYSDKNIYMHRELMNAQKGHIIDHINRNKLDNRRSNLRFVTHSQNQWNRDKQRTNTSGYKGVSWNIGAKKWSASIYFDGKSRHLGLCDIPEDAAKLYNEAASKRFGIYDRLGQLSNNP